MKRIKITDLDEFALRHLIKPYQDLCGYGFDEKLTKLPCSLDDICKMFYNPKYDEWKEFTMKRCAGIPFYFPKYIRHELVDIVRNARQKY